MAQTPEGTTAPVQAPAGRVPRRIVDVPVCYKFCPKARELIKVYLIPSALRGVRVPYEDTVADDVDVYAVRPEALPFPRRNKGVHGRVWAYFFTKRPTAAGGTGDEDDVRDVAAGGCWRRYGDDKTYVGRDGEVYAFCRRFAFHETGGRRRKTVWRVKEFRLKETAPTFRRKVFHPDAKGLVIWKVYNDVIPEEESVDYYGNGMKDSDEEEEEEEETGPVVITVGDAAAAPTPNA